MSWFRCTSGSGGSLKLRTASGAIASFETNLTALLNSLKCEITASGGNGSPDSPIPIVGHSELNLTRCGINQFDEQTETGYYDSATGEKKPLASEIRSTNLIPVTPNTTYAKVGLLAGYSFIFFDSAKNFISRYVSGGSTFTTPANCYYIGINFGGNYGNTYNHDVSINYPATDTEYHAYNGQTFTVAFGQTVYGGVYDKSGRLTITHGYVDLGSLTWIAAITNVTGKVRMRAALTHKATPNSVVFNAKCDIYNAITASETYTCVEGISGENTGSYIFVYDSNYSTTADLSAFTSMVNGHYLAYELATPIVIDVPSISVFAENGVNNVFSDIGDTEVKYLYKA